MKNGFTQQEMQEMKELEEEFLAKRAEEQAAYEEAMLKNSKFIE